MNTTQLECFLEVANSLNFSRAAEHLKLTQPAVSHQIKSLEDELGVKLFVRTSKSVRLTQEGHLYTQYASDILKLAGLSRARVKECQASRPMRFGIGCRNVAQMQLLRQVLIRLRLEELPVLPVLRLIPFDSLENLLQEGDIQMMFTFQETSPKNGVYRELLQCPVVCICAPDHPLSQHQQLQISQLQGAGRIAVCRPPICPPSLFALQGQIISLNGPDHVFFCESQEELLFLTETGYAFGLMLDFPTLRRENLRYIPLPDCPPLSFGMAYLPGEHNPLVRRVLTLLREELETASAKAP